MFDAAGTCAHANAGRKTLRMKAIAGTARLGRHESGLTDALAATVARTSCFTCTSTRTATVTSNLPLDDCAVAFAMN